MRKLQYLSLPVVFFIATGICLGESGLLPLQGEARGDTEDIAYKAALSDLSTQKISLTNHCRPYSNITRRCDNDDPQGLWTCQVWQDMLLVGLSFIIMGFE